MTGHFNKLEDDLAWLRGKAHETDFCRTAASLLNHQFGFRRASVVHGACCVVSRYAEEFADSIAGAAEDGTITDEQLQRIFATDVIVQCRHPQSSELVWVAVESPAALTKATSTAPCSRPRFSAPYSPRKPYP